MKALFRYVVVGVISIGFVIAASPSSEPGNDMDHAFEIVPNKTYTEHLDSVDVHDFYKFKVAYSESITLTMTPTSGNDFDLALYDCNGIGISNSTHPAGQRDIVTGIVKDSSCEYWYADVFRHSGEGNYYLYLEKDTIKPEWTLMVYLNGDNNLESFAYQDFNEMEAANPSPYVNVVVQFDTKSGGTYRYLIRGDNDPNRINSPVVDNPGEQNMGDGNTLVNFVRWAVNKYPAKKYGLILWDHGSGWHKGKTQPTSPLKGVSQDESSGGDFIGVSNGELKSALSSIKSIVGGKLDFLGFDACLMGMWEVLDVIKDYAKFTTVSEQTEGGQGWYYTGFANVLPSWDGAGLASQIVNSQQGLATLAAIDLSKIERLTQTVNDFAEALINQRPALSSAIDDARAHFYHDGASGHDHEYGWESSYNNREDIDLFRFAYYINNDSRFPESVRKLAQDVMSAVGGAVINLSTASDYRDDSHGISIYYPSDPRNYNHSIFGGNYDNLPVARKTKWDEFIKGEEGGANYDYTLTTTAYNWIDTRNATGITGDDQSKAFSLPFTFKFYGVDYNSVYVSSNGFLSFTSNNSGYNPQRIPDNAAPNAVIAPLWRDLDPSKAGHITYYSGSDKFVITWEGVKNYRTDNRQTFQVILYPNGEIVFQYKDVTNDVTTTIGLEDQNGNKGKNAGAPRNGTAYRWIPTTKNILTSTSSKVFVKRVYYLNGELNLEFSSMPSSEVNISVYNVLGRKVSQKVIKAMPHIAWRVGTLPRGVYLVTLKVDNTLYTRKFYVIR